jgi:hypothetical protein
LKKTFTDYVYAEMMFLQQIKNNRSRGADRDWRHYKNHMIRILGPGLPLPVISEGELLPCIDPAISFSVEPRYR